MIDAADVSDFELPSPPTGPAVETPTREQNRYVAYLEWRGTRDGSCVWAYLKARVRELLLHKPDPRISVKGLVEACRAELKVEINNTYTAWLADDLVRWDPRLLNLIERRRRRKGTT